MPFIARPNRKFKSAKGNGYIKVKHEGKDTIVVMDRQCNEDWDKIEKLEIGLVHYDHTMQEGDEAGKPTGPEMDRYEVTDYVTYSRQDFVDEMKVRRADRKAKLLKALELESVGEAEELA